MHKLLGIVALFALVGCGGPNPKEFCDQTTRKLCEWGKRCEAFSGTVEECIADFQSLNDCRDATEADYCNAGQKFNPGAAQKCLDVLSSLQCDGSATGDCPDLCTAM